ncbi:hypothetical protein F0P93_05795 [Larkinella humicola]|uniref:YD repeat-containing protein n=1 Tax=Larkinella humicola TaxID=2607654 RepID=A0A5N1JPH9_9BACT|nr:hypothetical protein F0P93_05795 [Larkinella humicola]
MSVMASLSTVSAFSYDDKGRLSLIVAYQLPDSSVAPVENTTFHYDDQNRLTQVEHSVVRRGSGSESYTLTYNGAGQLTKLENSPSTFSIVPQYNSDNKISSYWRSIDVGGLSSNGGGEFTFTGNNLTSTTDAFSVSRTGGGPLVVYSRSINSTYTFDDQTNPFYGVFIIPAPGVFRPFANSPSAFDPYYTFYGGIDNYYNLSQNNVLTVVSSNGTTTSYNYAYNGSNLPITRTTTINGKVTEILQYEYES